MISLRVSATNLVNKNEPEGIPKKFPSRRELAMNYAFCYEFFLFLIIFIIRVYTISAKFHIYSLESVVLLN